MSDDLLLARINESIRGAVFKNITDFGGVLSKALAHSILGEELQKRIPDPDQYRLHVTRQLMMALVECAVSYAVLTTPGREDCKVDDMIQISDEFIKLFRKFLQDQSLTYEDVKPTIDLATMKGENN